MYVHNMAYGVLNSGMRKIVDKIVQKILRKITYAKNCGKENYGKKL